MMRFSIFLALLVVTGVALLVRRWRMEREWRTILVGVGLIGGGIVLGSFSISMLVYKPLLILHLAAMILYIAGVGIYLWQKKWIYWALLAPVATSALFFAIGWAVHYEF